MKSLVPSFWFKPHKLLTNPLIFIRHEECRSYCMYVIFWRIWVKDEERTWLLLLFGLFGKIFCIFKVFCMQYNIISSSKEDIFNWFDKWTCTAKLPRFLEIAKDCLLTGQEQACTRITFGRSFVCLGVTMPKVAEYTGKWLLTTPKWSHP